jgi:hypothetical protein
MGGPVVDVGATVGFIVVLSFQFRRVSRSVGKDGDLHARPVSGSGNTMLPRTRRVAADRRRVAGDPERR